MKSVDLVQKRSYQSKAEVEEYKNEVLFPDSGVFSFYRKS